jgi:hypothetical protein
MKLTIPPTGAKLTHLNTRIQMHGEDEVLACDLSLEFEITAEEILPLLCSGDWKPLKNALWESSQERKAREQSLNAFSFNNKFEDHCFKFRPNMGGKLSEDKGTIATIKKIKLTPQHGAVALIQCMVQVTPSLKQESAYCDGLINKAVQFSIDPPTHPIEQSKLELVG